MYCIKRCLFKQMKWTFTNVRGGLRKMFVHTWRINAICFDFYVGIHMNTYIHLSSYWRGLEGHSTYAALFNKIYLFLSFIHRLQVMTIPFIHHPSEAILAFYRKYLFTYLLTYTYAYPEQFGSLLLLNKIFKTVCSIRVLK